LDPVGSLIIVKYSVGVDGNGYTEKRRIIKNYGSDGSSNVSVNGSVTVTTTTETDTNAVVSRIIGQLKPTIISVIRSTVQVTTFVTL